MHNSLGNFFKRNILVYLLSPEFTTFLYLVSTVTKLSATFILKQEVNKCPDS